MLIVFLVACLGLLCPLGCQGQGSYNDLLNELSQLYERVYDDGRYDDGQIVSRSGSDDWNNVPYREPTLNDPGYFSEAVLRDQEYMENSPLWGYQSVSGRTIISLYL